MKTLLASMLFFTFAFALDSINPYEGLVGMPDKPTMFQKPHERAVDDYLKGPKSLSDCAVYWQNYTIHECHAMFPEQAELSLEIMLLEQESKELFHTCLKNKDRKACKAYQQKLKDVEVLKAKRKNIK